LPPDSYLRLLLLGILVTLILSPPPQIQAQEDTVTYFSRDEFPVTLSWPGALQRQLSIEIPDDLSNVTQAELSLTVYDSDRRGEARFEVEDEEYRIPRTGSEQIGSFNFKIPVEGLSNTIIILFIYESGFLSDGIEIRALSLTLTFSRPENPLPIADPGDTYYGVEGSEVLFNGSESYDPDGTIQAYLWIFGDNASSTDAKPIHSYLTDGEYLVTLTVTDNDGASTTATTRAIIDDIDPLAYFIVTPVTTTPTPIYRFTDVSSSHDGIVQWAWDFGDGAQSTDSEPLHAYPSPGNYSITLLVSEADGDQAALTY
jgi:chitodextrinase